MNIFKRFLAWLDSILKKSQAESKTPSESGPAPAPDVNQPATPAPAEPKWLELAKADIGRMKEVQGSGDNPAIVAMIKRAGLEPSLQHDSTAWCGVYAFSKLLDAGIAREDLPKDPAWAANWRSFGVATSFRPGCIACVPSKAAASGYHVTFAARIIGDKVFCVGGNQSDEVNETAFPIAGVIFRWPKDPTKTEQTANASALLVLKMDKAPGALPDFGKKTFRELRPRYSYLYSTAKLENLSRVDWYVKRLLEGRSRYEAMQAKTGVPWILIGAIHAMEASFRWDAYLGNGDSLSKPTKNVPAGRGPFKTWEDGALDALAYDGLSGRASWSLEEVLYFAEKFNGMGYYGKLDVNGEVCNSPYLWSTTNHHRRGKYIRDHVFDPAAIDDQCGVAAMFKRLEQVGAINIQA
jgi:lysozyme family protein